MFASCQLSGINFSFPDICLTPPTPPSGLPVPYLNQAMNVVASAGQSKVKWLAADAHMAFSTEITTSTGDEPGTLGGIISHMIKGPCRALTGAFTVLVVGRPAWRMTSITLQNKFNMIGVSLVPSQCKVLLLAP
jgi:hypothetical protein